ncbi:MAG TPA: hypothetical protein VFM79_00415 [Pelobium sp.]|nr:hypothetical protein [Pelobium sp.]
MISTAKVKQWSIENGKRILKLLQFGAKTAKVAAPFGDDSNPVKDMTAIFAETSEKGEAVVIGYINTDMVAKVGEKRIFSLKENGTPSTFIWLKNDATMEIGGSADHAVRFTPLSAGITAKDTQINANLALIAAAITTLGGSYTPTPVSTNIEGAKIQEIKTL